MSELSAHDVSSPPLYTEYGIPIRNLWHMLQYAWKELPATALRGRVLETVERAPTLDSLLASMLIQLMQQRLRIGLGHEYRSEQRILRGLRGRINFAESLRQRGLESGMLVCDCESYGANATKNQIVRSTLARLLKLGRFGDDPSLVAELHQKLRGLLRDLDGIDFIELTPELILRQLLAQADNEHDYRLMLSICALIVQRQMPLAAEGRAPLPLIDRELLVLYRVYERFVAGFYRTHLQGWQVSAQKRLEWHTPEPDNRLPLMVPDLVLEENATGRIIVLDTKFTVHSLVQNAWGKPVYDSSHLYQMYAYLRSQEHLSQAHATAVGILLYPAVKHTLSQQIRLQGHVIRLESLDLAALWQEVERQLMAFVTEPAAGASRAADL